MENIINERVVGQFYQNHFYICYLFIENAIIDPNVYKLDYFLSSYENIFSCTYVASNLTAIKSMKNKIPESF